MRSASVVIDWLVRVTTVVGVIAGLYAVLVAFVIVNEWQAINSAQAQVANESAA